IVGKANFHELAFGATGVYPWYGTPENPLDPSLVPGGSSSGSAVAVATDEAEVAYGSDTGGSVRIPSACCGTAGLKTTHGRISLEGVWPLALSLDTIGPMARDVAGLVRGMHRLEPGFAVAPRPPATGCRSRPARPDPQSAGGAGHHRRHRAREPGGHPRPGVARPDHRPPPGQPPTHGPTEQRGPPSRRRRRHRVRRLLTPGGTGPRSVGARRYRRS